MDPNKHEMDGARNLTQRRGTCREGAKMHPEGSAQAETSDLKQGNSGWIAE
jgi:hypothetical protein